mmetsp:Transcript_59705/g.69791  ORF Transcript_59705/g.69791 Transcript_59705/m.69791 type:complete len:340 (+) Transcript_59705:172-1191(+)
MFAKMTNSALSSSVTHDGMEEQCSDIGRVALLQFHVSHDKQTNLSTALKFLKRAKDENAQLAVLPEIWNSPYATSAFNEYAEIIPDGTAGVLTDDDVFSSPSVKLLIDMAKELNIWIIGGSIPERTVAKDRSTEDKIYNTCICIDPKGRIVAKHRKVHLFDIDVPGKITFKESDTLSPGDSVTTFDAGKPFGRIGVGICYDIRFPELAQCMVQRGCQLLVYPGAFNLTTGPAHWELLQRARAVDGMCYVLTASPARTLPPDESQNDSKYPHYTAWGHSTAISPWGEIVGKCDENARVLVIDLDMTKVGEMRRSIPTFSQKRRDLYNVEDITASDQSNKV